GRRPHAKPDSAHRMDERVGLPAVDFSAESPDIDVDDVGGGIKVNVPYVLQQHCARDDLAFIAHQTFEDLVFSRQQIDGAAAAARCARHEVELEIADSKYSLLHHGGAAPGERLDPRQKFHEGEWLDQVIVTTGAEPAHPIVDLPERADDQGR